MPQASRVTNRSLQPDTLQRGRPMATPFWGVEGGFKGGRGATSPSLVNAHKPLITGSTIANPLASITLKPVSKKPRAIQGWLGSKSRRRHS